MDASTVISPLRCNCSRPTDPEAQILHLERAEPARGSGADADRQSETAEALAAAGEKRTRSEAALSDPMPFSMHGRQKAPKLKKGLQGKKGEPRRLRMMQGEGRWDPVSWFKKRPIREEDGLTLGHLLDYSPAMTMEISRGLVRPSRSKIGNIRMIGSEDQMEPEVPGAHAILPVFGRDPKIRNFYITQMVIQESKAYKVQRMLLDSGSIIDTANKEVAKKLGLVFTEIQHYHFKTADGHVASSRFRTTATVSIHGVTRTLDFLVLEGNTPYSFLLGSPALHQFFASIDYALIPATYTVRESPNAKHI